MCRANAAATDVIERLWAPTTLTCHRKKLRLRPQSPACSRRYHADVGAGARAGRRAEAARRARLFRRHRRLVRSQTVFKDAGKQVENFGHEAGVAAKTTVDTAKDAAGAVARIPGGPRHVPATRNAATRRTARPTAWPPPMRLCKAKGFESGKSLDMTTAEVCPPKVLLSGRTAPRPSARTRPSCPGRSANNRSSLSLRRALVARRACVSLPRIQ